MKTATYQTKKVYVQYVAENAMFMLISYSEDGSKAFKVDASELTDLNFKVEPITY